jgi:hypothetical protein
MLSEQTNRPSRDQCGKSSKGLHASRQSQSVLPLHDSCTLYVALRLQLTEAAAKTIA